MTHMNYRPKNEIPICQMNMTQIIYDINFKNPVYITFFLIRAFCSVGEIYRRGARIDIIT